MCPKTPIQIPCQSWVGMVAPMLSHKAHTRNAQTKLARLVHGETLK